MAAHYVLPSKIPSKLLGMASDSKGVSTIERNMFLGYIPLVTREILAGRHPVNLIFQSPEHGIEETYSLFQTVIVAESVNPLGNPVQVSVTHVKDI